MAAMRAHSGSPGGRAEGAAVARLGQEPFGEIEPLGQLGDLGAEDVHVLGEHLGAARMSPDFRVPPAQAAAVDVAEVAGGDDDQVVEVPDAEAAERDAHERAALRLADVEAVGAERAEQGGQGSRHAAGLFGGIERAGEVVHGLNIPGFGAAVHGAAARLAGIEPATTGLEGRCSIQLSYRRGLPIRYPATRQTASRSGRPGHLARCRPTLLRTIAQLAVAVVSQQKALSFAATPQVKKLPALI